MSSYWPFTNLGKGADGQPAPPPPPTALPPAAVSGQPAPPLPPPAVAGPAPPAPTSGDIPSLRQTANDFANNAANYATTAGMEFNDAVGTIGNKLQTMPSLFSDVGNTSITGNLTEWVSSENWFAKIIFVILMFVLFFFLLRIALTLILFIVPSIETPYLISGYLEGGKSVEIRQDPRSEEKSKIVRRSKNQLSGIEFSWCVWLYVDSQSLPSTSNSEEYVIFNKGEPSTQCAPCLIVGRKKMVSGKDTEYTAATGTTRGSDIAYLRVRMETYDTDENDGVTEDASIMNIEIGNIPIQKWVHVCLRLQNTAFDVYINGNITKRTILPAVPRQNYSNVFVFPTKTNTSKTTFSGFLSDLVYYPYALNPYRLNAMVSSGPNKSPSVVSATKLAKTGESDFLSSQWYLHQRT
jgi:hypothetical protein